MNRKVYFIVLLPVILMMPVFFTASKAEISWGEFVEKVETINVSPKKVIATTSVYFVGDILLGRDVERRMKLEDNDYPYRNFSFETGAYVVGNFEAAIPELHLPTPDMSTVFSVASSAIPALKSAGLTHLSLANNHSLDFGQVGYDNTKSVLHDNDLVAFGGWTEDETSLTYLDTDFGKIALLGILDFGHELDMQSVSELLIEAESEAFKTVVYIHWGLEYELKHAAKQSDLAVEFISHGADLIVGHHPHVVQDVDLIDGVPVFYSLGNFIFDQYFSQEVQESLVLKYMISPEGKEVIELVPYSSVGSRNSPYLMDYGRKTEFLAKLADRSDPVLKSAILRQRIEIN